MNRFLNFGVALALSAGMVTAHAATSYDVVTTWYEPDTQPNNTLFVGSFDYDAATRTVTNLQGQLSESMTGMMGGMMTWLSLDHQLASWYDAALGGTFAAAFRNTDTRTFWTGAGGNGWSPESGIAAGGVHYGFPSARANPGNAYALIFIPDDPLTALTQAQINKLAYADCAAGGMMGAVCMTGTSAAGYGAEGTMSGYPLSQTITAAVPEPETWGLMLAGLILTGALARRRNTI
ncbi:MAG: PEP-CTERM sorting domain-containing protein [Methyloversatilis sp.]|jgi:hypothetical protein|nr:PEP-CTERM sorting domain-containing protein [Methyloversatilis sp.]